MGVRVWGVTCAAVFRATRGASVKKVSRITKWILIMIRNTEEAV